MSQDSGTLAKIRGNWPGERPPNVPVLLIGPSASGASVLADRRTTDSILAQHRDLLAIEMEVYGVFAAAEECSMPRPMAFSMKAVVDFADGEKNDKYQGYAAFVSARTLQHFVETVL